MELKRIGILAVALTLFTVMACGMASAASYSYSGEFVTTLASDHSTVLMYHSWGNIGTVTSSDTLTWWNLFNNMQTHQVYAKVTQTTSPSGGLKAGDSGWYPVPAGDGTNPGSSNEYTYTSGLNSLGSHTINAVQVFLDGSTQYTGPTNNMMSYY